MNRAANAGNSSKRSIRCVSDTDGTTTEIKNILINIRDSRRPSVGTPPINSYHIDFMSQIQLGGHVRDLRKYRDVIGVTGDINEARTGIYLMDTLEQMISQSTPLHDKSRNLRLPAPQQVGREFQRDERHDPYWSCPGTPTKPSPLLRGDVFSKGTASW
ncbi:MAG: hypothetical protein ACLR8Y_19755 [Alistipes indistinctus]